MKRLIDAQDTFNVLSDYYHHHTSAQHLALQDALSKVPTAVPVKRGKWIDETFEPWGLVHHPYKCNLCGEHAEFASPYCPNCGARMDEDGKTD